MTDPMFLANSSRQSQDYFVKHNNSQSAVLTVMGGFASLFILSLVFGIHGHVKGLTIAGGIGIGGTISGSIGFLYKEGRLDFIINKFFKKEATPDKSTALIL